MRMYMFAASLSVTSIKVLKSDVIAGLLLSQKALKMYFALMHTLHVASLALAGGFLVQHVRSVAYLELTN